MTNKKFLSAVVLLFLAPTLASAASCTFTASTALRVGMAHSDIKTLQRALNANPLTQVAAVGDGSLGHETTYFGKKTKAALVKFQELYKGEVLTPVGLTKGSGVFGTMTRKKLIALCGEEVTLPVVSANPLLLPTSNYGGGGGWSSPSPSPAASPYTNSAGNISANAPIPATPAPSPVPPTPSPIPSPTPTPTPVVASDAGTIVFQNYATNWSASGQWVTNSAAAFEVVNTTLQNLSGRGTYGDYAYLGTVTTNSQAVEVVRKGGVFTGTLSLRLLADASASKYAVEFSPTYFGFRRAGAWVGESYAIPHSINWANDVTLRLQIIDGVMKIFANGAEIYTYTDASPLAGGSPGFSLAPAANPAGQRLVSFKGVSYGGGVAVINPAPIPTPSPTPTPNPTPTPTPVVTVPNIPSALPGMVQTLTANNPVTVAMTGAHMTYNVGPGKTYTEPDTVPWATLVAGDVVNIFYRSTPYLWKIGLRGQGTQAYPIVVNGVTDANGNRPMFNFAGAKTASGSASMWSATPAYGESLGGFVIKRGPNDDYYSYQPKWIQIKNFELYGAANGATYTTTLGVTTGYSGAAALYIHVGEDILLENNVIHNNGFGIFSMAKDEILSQATTRLTIRNNRVYDNGVPGSYYVHNLYVQNANPVVEGNYFGKVISGSLGSSYKSRSSGEIFRNNYVVASARALDFVFSEEQSQGIAAQSDYGTDYVHDNIIVSSGPECIHYGGDNGGEQETGALFTPPAGYIYRSHLFFWNNVCKITSSDWRTNIFDLSLRDTLVDAWNDSFIIDWTGGGDLSWLQFAGKLKLGLGNTVNRALLDARSDATAGMYSVTSGNPTPTIPSGK